MKFFRNAFFLVGLTSSFASASAEPNFTLIDEYFHALKDVPIDLRNHGPLCEEMARLQWQRLYQPEEYEVVVGIVYRNDHRVVGELDLVIFRKSDHEALAVAEVKCQRRMGRARDHAQEQLERFADTIEEEEVREMYLLDDDSVRYYPTSFDEEPTHWTIGQKGAVDAGFAYELELDLDDILFLQDRLQRCQSSGQCS